MSLPWFAGWLRTHLARHHCLGLPDPRVVPEFFEAWESELERHHITERAAVCASIRMCSQAKPPRVHFEQLLKTALALVPKPKEAEHKGAAPPYVPPPPPRGAELDECIKTAAGSTPVARNMRLELRGYIMAEQVDPRRIPLAVLELIAEEPEKLEPITPPRLRSAHVNHVLEV